MTARYQQPRTGVGQEETRLFVAPRSGSIGTTTAPACSTPVETIANSGRLANMTPPGHPGRDLGRRDRRRTVAALSPTPKNVVVSPSQPQRGTSGVHVCRLDEMQAQSWSLKNSRAARLDCFDDGIRRDRLSMESVTTSAACRCGSQTTPYPDGRIPRTYRSSQRLDQSGQRAAEHARKFGHLRITVDVGDDVQLVL